MGPALRGTNPGTHIFAISPLTVITADEPFGAIELISIVTPFASSDWIASLKVPTRKRKPCKYPLPGRGLNLINQHPVHSESRVESGILAHLDNIIMRRIRWIEGDADETHASWPSLIERSQSVS